MFHGVDKDIAFYSLSILNAASVFGRTIPNVRYSFPANFVNDADDQW